MLCSLFTAAGGIMLASQVAIGDPSVGLNYTLTSITAVVLGGASIFGGRGSFIGAFCGAVLIQEIVTSTTFLQHRNRVAVLPAGDPDPRRCGHLLAHAQPAAAGDGARDGSLTHDDRGAP